MSSSSLPADLEVEVSAYVFTVVNAGFDPLEDIPEEAGYYFSINERHDIDEDTFLKFVEAEVCRIVDRIKLEQETWPAVTDWDRLVEAFNKLEAAGVIARHDFDMSCGSGSYAMGEEMRSAVSQGYAVRGGIFYHFQDRERAANDHGLYINFDAASMSTADIIAVGKQTRDALEAEGLKVEWDGTEQTRLFIPMKWQRRFPRESTEGNLANLPRKNQ